MQMNNIDAALKFQREQQDIAMKIGAYLAPIGVFLEKCKADQSFAADINAIRHLQPSVDNQSFLTAVDQFLSGYNYTAYFGGIASPCHSFAKLLAQQTLPSKRKDTSTFINDIENNYNVMAETLIAIAQIALPPVDLTIKAQNPFTAYCFVTRILSTVKDYLYVMDPWIDATLFYRYLYQVPKTAKIRIISSSKNWVRKIEEVESVEELFKVEYPNYDRKDDPTLHDRRIITETAAFSLGGSIKDAAKTSEYTIVQLTETSRQKLIKNHFDNW